LNLKYGTSLAFSALSMLYPWVDFKNKFHTDHIYPKSGFSKKALRGLKMAENHIDDALDSRDRLPNLQLLPGIENQEKSDIDFSEWFLAVEDKEEYRRRNFIPEGHWTPDECNKFFEARRELLRKELRGILRVGSGEKETEAEV